MAVNNIEKPMEPVDPKNMGLGEPDIEIEIEDPEKVSIEMGGLEIEIEPGKESNEDFNANLAEDMEEEELAMLSEDLLGDFNDDIASRRDWMQTYVDGLTCWV